MKKLVGIAKSRGLGLRFKELEMETVPGIEKTREAPLETKKLGERRLEKVLPRTKELRVVIPEIKKLGEEVLEGRKNWYLSFYQDFGIFVAEFLLWLLLLFISGVVFFFSTI